MYIPAEISLPSTTESPKKCQPELTHFRTFFTSSVVLVGRLSPGSHPDSHPVYNTPSHPRSRDHKAALTQFSPCLSLLYSAFSATEALTTLSEEYNDTYDHRVWKTGLPVRSAVLKPHAGELVVGWVTTSESSLLYVLFIFLPFKKSRNLIWSNHRCRMECPAVTATRNKATNRHGREDRDLHWKY